MVRNQARSRQNGIGPAADPAPGRPTQRRGRITAGL